MAPDKTKQVLDVIEECKRAASSTQERDKLDQYAIHMISHDHRPQVMADNLAYWLGTPHWLPREMPAL